MYLLNKQKHDWVYFFKMKQFIQLFAKVYAMSKYSVLLNKQISWSKVCIIFQQLVDQLQQGKTI